MRKHSLRQKANQYLETNNKGSHRDKKYRRFIIHQLIEDLFIIGDVPPNWHRLTTEHLQKLVKHWHKKNIKSSTLMNHMTVIRQFLQNMDSDAYKSDNRSLGIVRKKLLKKIPKNSPDLWLNIHDPSARILLGLQIHFGLTLSEAMRILPDIHVQEDRLWLTREITFNSQDRVIPLRSEIQERIIHEFNELTQRKNNLISVQGYQALCFSWRKSLQAINLSPYKSYRYHYAQQVHSKLSPILGHYELSLLIMAEMGLKSRTTLWTYLHE